MWWSILVTEVVLCLEELCFWLGCNISTLFLWAINVYSFMFTHSHIHLRVNSQNEPDVKIRVHGYVHFAIIIYIIIVETIRFSVWQKSICNLCGQCYRNQQITEKQRSWGYIVIHYIFILNTYILFWMLSLEKSYLGDKSRLVKKQKNKQNNKLKFLVLISGQIFYVRSHTM